LLIPMDPVDRPLEPRQRGEPYPLSAKAFAPPAGQQNAIFAGAITIELDYAAGIGKLLRRPAADKGVDDTGRLPLCNGWEVDFRSSERDDALI
jgi:hypothetical protein